MNWDCETWRSGGPAAGSSGLTSFGRADEVLRRVADKVLFPNLQSVVVAGFSAGGQFVSRYAMANLVHGKLPLTLTYVVGSPSIYPYLDTLRPSAAAPLTFAAYRDARNCSGFDRFPYGLTDRSGYAGPISEEQLRRQLASRPVTYLLAALDNLPLFGFDESCPAMAQGSSRLARGQAYFQYITERFAAPHRAVTIRACGHNPRCVFTDDAALPVLFPEP